MSARRVTKMRPMSPPAPMPTVRSQACPLSMEQLKFKMRLRRVDASSIYTCCELIKCMRYKTAQDNAPKLEAAAKRHKQTIDTKTPQEKQHEAKQHEAGKSFAGNGQFHSC